MIGFFFWPGPSRAASSGSFSSSSSSSSSERFRHAKSHEREVMFMLATVRRPFLEKFWFTTQAMSMLYISSSTRTSMLDMK